jgi:beta-barrel assembly-enhancing protease
MEHDKPSPFALAQEARVQEEMVVQAEDAKTRDLERVYWPIIAANAGLCPKTALSLGVSFWNAQSFPAGPRRDLAREALGLSETPVVRFVVPGGPADGLGIAPGDVLRAINGKPVEPGKNPQTAVKRALKAAEPGTPVTLTLVRAGGQEAHEVAAAPVEVCAYPVVHRIKSSQDNTEINAYADGKKVTILPGMTRFATTDAEMALVLGHELAHNILEHPDKTAQNMNIGRIFDTVLDVAQAVNTGGADMTANVPNYGEALGRLAYSKAFEREADYLGLYLTARAGYDISGAAGFWRRMAAEVDGGPKLWGTTHPTTPERFLNLEATAREIAAKRAAGQPLEPKHDPTPDT